MRLRKPGRRWHALTGALVTLLVSMACPAAELGYTPVVPGVPVDAVRDAGSHPGFRTEWWYVTGWLVDGDGQEIGFQITFFRTRPRIDADNPSRFAAHELIIAHAALLPGGGGPAWHDERMARAGFGLSFADQAKTDVAIDDWHLAARGDGLSAEAAGEGGGFSLTLTPTGPPLLEGEAGFSRKGASAGAASYYYSVPQLRVAGELRLGDKRRRVTGRAWLDHEWSSEMLEPGAVGWDWVGINGDDGSALMAFRIRDRRGAPRYAGASRRDAAGHVERFGPDGVRFTPLRQWRSPRTGTSYPVEWQLEVGGLSYRLAPLVDDQEADTRRTTGAVYWEGAIRSRAGAATGHGFLELTGYGVPLSLP